MIVTFYKNCKIQPNHCIQDVMTYLSKLSTKEVFTLADSKAFKSDLDSFSVRVDLSDKSSDIYANYKDFNYCTIGDSIHTQMYFITGWTNISQYIYEANVTIDAVNTYNKDAMDKDLFKQVSVKRRHKNRWKMTEGDTGLYQRIYDEVDEGLGQVTSEVEKSPALTDTTYDICYEYPTTNNACSKYFTRVLPKETKDITLKQQHLILGDTLIDYSSTSGTILESFLIKVPNKVDGVVKCNSFPYDNNSASSYANAYLFTGYSQCLSNVAVYYGTLKLLKLDSVNSGTVVRAFECIFNKGKENRLEFYADDRIEIYKIDSNWQVKEGETVNISPFTNLIANSTLETVTESIKGRNAITLVDSQIKSLQEIPASNTSNFYYYGDNEAFIASNVVKTNCTYTYDSLISWSTPVTTRAKMYESKLYGSYVRNYYLAYDNYTLPIQPEYLQSPTVVTASFTSSTDMTNTYLIQATNQLESKLYSNHLVCTRNNGVATFDDAYIEYIRNGYNYDKKQETMSNWKNGLSVAANALGVGLNIGNRKEVGRALGIFGVAQNAVNTASSLTNAIMSGVENAQALSNKRQQLMATSPSISGNSSLDIFNEYAGNALRFVVEKPTDEVLANIYNLFYFTGYADNLYYDTMPIIKTRQYFNYVQADINYSTITNPKERQRLIDAYSNGITFEWQYNNTWLMEGNLYENWEYSI